MKHIVRLIAPAVLFGALLMGVPAQAQSFDRVVQAEVLTGWRTTDGSHMAALRLTLNPGWKTYWRAPGDAGIPPRINWGGSGNLDSVRITWPTPKVFSQNGMQSIGYKEEVILPVRIAPLDAGKPIDLHAVLDIGVCRDICVPQHLSVAAKLVPEDVKRDPRITSALAARPFSRAEAKVRSVTCRIAPTADGMKVTTRIRMPSAGGTEVAVVETGDPDLWVAEAQSHREGGVLTATTEIMHVDAEPFLLDRSALRFTVFGKHHAVDITGCTSG